ncbi:hypothetical protein HGRIS_011944 [Hohenbuehelia grisea]|uniref:Uncharacterized protein n=1 Tax=Hohenbuehelia grisea TaxID=104357 RepID=A0ABR3JWM1_9AGAR
MMSVDCIFSETRQLEKLRKLAKRLRELSSAGDIINQKNNIAEELDKVIQESVTEENLAASSASSKTLKELNLVDATLLQSRVPDLSDIIEGTDAFHRTAEKARAFARVDTNRETSHRTHLDVLLLEVLLRCTQQTSSQKTACLFYEVEAEAKGIITTDETVTYRITAKIDYIMAMGDSGILQPIPPQLLSSPDFWSIFAKEPVLLVEAKSEKTLEDGIPQTLVETLAFEMQTKYVWRSQSRMIADKQRIRRIPIQQGKVRFIVASATRFYFGFINRQAPRQYWLSTAHTFTFRDGVLLICLVHPAAPPSRLTVQHGTNCSHTFMIGWANLQKPV